MDWKPHAARLADTVVHHTSGWYAPLAHVPRHTFIPRWFTAGPDGWHTTDGQDDEDAWAANAYSDTSVVTRVGPQHADDAPTGTPVIGRPSSSSTHPGLVVQMLSHAHLTHGARILDVATGSGYSAALTAYRYGDQNVTSIDVDPYLTKAAADRLASAGLHPEVITCDATGDLPGEYDRIVSMVSMPTIPASWLTALRRRGRLVTTLADTGLVITADKTPDGGAAGRVEWDRAAFMTTRAGNDYPPTLNDLFTAIRHEDGEQTATSPYPVISVMEAWEVWSMLSLTAPGIEHRMQRNDDGTTTAWMLHADGSWARATSPAGSTTSTVHQGGPRRLWDELDAIRARWLREGQLPVYGARVTITPDGATRLERNGWTVTL